jgi:hypothetical protein
MLPFYVEVQPRLGSGQLALAWSPTPAHVQFSQFEIKISVADDTAIVKLPFAVALEQVQAQAALGYTYVRFRVDSTRRSPDEASHFKVWNQVFQPDTVLQLSRASHITCRACSSSILRKPDLLFTRVHPLPSEGWYELNESLSCHASHTAKHRLTPGPGVCLVGSDYALVAVADIVPGSVIFPPPVDESNSMAAPTVYIWLICMYMPFVCVCCLIYIYCLTTVAV